MNEHAEIYALLPQYAAGQLTAVQKQAVDRHMAGCDACRAELAFWQDVCGVVKENPVQAAAPRAALQAALAEIRVEEQRTSPFAHVWQVLKSQAPLVRSEIWSASFLVLMLGFIVTLVADKAAAFYAIAPVVSAAGLALLYGGKQDAAFELTLATPTSQVEILLARSLLVFSYNLLLTVLISLGLAAVYSVSTVGLLISEWIAPMTFLSALGLGVSVIAGSENAILITYLIWLSRYLMMTSTARKFFGSGAQILLSFWQSNAILYGLSALMFLFVIVSLKTHSGTARQLSNRQ
jgi:hypothetical protein